MPEDSTHIVEVVPVVLEPHPNADSLSIVRVHGFTVCVRTTDWENGQLGAYIQPDSIVDITRPEFSFLDNPRIKVKKLRGVVSMGLLVKAPEGSNIGDNVADILGVTHYEPIINAKTGGEAEGAPSGLYSPKYDVDSMYRYYTAFIPGELVFATEKIHGCLTRDTMVLMAEGGEKQICDILAEDRVVCYDTEHGIFVKGTVEKLIVRDACFGWMRLDFDCGKHLICTRDHPILTNNRGWVEAENLTKEDEIVSV